MVALGGAIATGGDSCRSTTSVDLVDCTLEDSIAGIIDKKPLGMKGSGAVGGAICIRHRGSLRIRGGVFLLCVKLRVRLELECGLMMMLMLMLMLMRKLMLMLNLRLRLEGGESAQV